MSGFLKHTLRSAAFIAGLLALLMILSVLFFPKNNSNDDGIQDPAANGILGEPDNTIDVLVIGDSESYSSFIPLQLWRDYGITSYCCGTIQQKLCYSEEFLHNAYRTQKPRIVILETGSIFRDFSTGDSLVKKIERVLPVFSYHNRWKSLKKQDLFLKTDYTCIYSTKGYVYNVNIVPVDPGNYMAETNECKKIPEKNIGYIKDIKSYCDEKGASLVLYSAPSTLNWNMKKHNSVAKLAEELDVDYIDTNLLNDKIKIDWNNDTRDKGDHMNYYGATKVTAYLGEYLYKAGMMDHRSDRAFWDWNTALDNFNQNSFDCIKE